ncbi:MAG: hypothetical protein JWN22_12 [Nocardioides sp.]|jgi:hypothetical protein|nr:hypothetical protein [Nocardioides sp.]
MFGVGVVEVLLVCLVLPFVGLFVLYAVIRMAVRDGSVDAGRRTDAERVRSQIGVGRERSPNTRR